ncbi:hypothetical protein Trydic_g15777 [Trypoxylus dichotomus]
MSPALLNQLMLDATTCVGRKASLEFYGVRITPPFIEFKDAFEGRTYRRYLTIRNVGKSKVLVKIAKPTSLAFSIKEVKGCALSPGLCLVKEVSYVYTHANVPYCMLPIYINEERVDYEIFAQSSAPEISFQPQSIEFGLVDTNSSSKTHILYLRNDGSKTTRFHVDSSSFLNHKIMVDPYKGHIQPRSVVEIHVNLISDVPGNVLGSLWLKCDKPFAIPVRGEVISPMFEPICDSLATSFIVIDFPPTYVGATSARTMYIRNYSASEAMFCIWGEVARQPMTLDCCKNSDKDFNYFDVFPKEGVWESKEVKMFHFFFKPTKCSSPQKLSPFYLCIYRIYRTKCKYLKDTMYEDAVFVDTKETVDTSQTWSGTGQLRGPETSVLLELNASCVLPPTHYQQPNEFLQLYLHGVAEEPSVTVVPNEIALNDLVEGERATRVLEFHNRSTKLPIIVSYKKVAFVDVERQTFRIEADKSVQLSLFVTARKLGKFGSKLKFDLSYYENFLEKNVLKVVGTIWVRIDVDVKSCKRSPLPEINAGITPNYIKEVGKFCQEVRFNSKVAKPRTALIEGLDNSSALIAFPNDTQKSLRPWRGEKTKTIFTKVPRYVPPLETEYEMTVFGKKMKLATATYYTNHVRKQAEKLRLLKGIPPPATVRSDYDLTDVSKLMCIDFPRVLPMNPPENMLAAVIPLTPAEMSNISIDPKVIHTGRIAVYSRYKFDLRIKNNNTHPIRVYVRPEKPHILFDKGHRIAIGAHDEADLPIAYLTESSGYYATSLSVIVNECGVFQVTILADVVRGFLNLNTNLLEFNEETIQFVEMSNPLNTYIPFEWSLPYENFSIEPREGTVRAFSKLLCQVTYLPEKEGPVAAEAELLIHDTINQVLNLRVIGASAPIHFVCKELVFTNIPLNIPVIEQTVLKNESSYSRTFTLIENELADYLTLDTMHGRVFRNSYTVICITMKMMTCGKFAAKLKFRVTGTDEIELYVSGNVVYPNIDVIPRTFKFEKMPASTTSVIKFTVENRSDAIASIKFNMSMYDEFKITYTPAHWEVESLEECILDAHSSKHLCLNFLPKAAITDKFFLPLIVNDILGPSNKGIDVSYRFDSESPFRPTSNSIIFVRATGVHVHSTEPKLQFSKFRIFLYYKIPPYACRNQYNLKVSNPQKVEESFCIITKYLQEPFYITHLSGKKITQCEKSIICRLAPREEVVFNIRYKPTTIGLHHLSMPVYLKSDQSQHPHNTLYIEGKFDAPAISIPNPLNYFKPGPLSVCNRVCVTVFLDNHLHNCKPSTVCDIPGLEAEFEEGPPNHLNRRILTLNVKYSTENLGKIASSFTISCSCGVSASAPVVACRENCFLTNYAQVHTFINNPEYNLELRDSRTRGNMKASLISLLEVPPPLKEIYELETYFVDYPFYPSDEIELKEFMDGGIRTVEYWVSSQVFVGKAFFEIPTGFAFVLFSSPVVVPPLIQLLIRLGGEDMKKCFDLQDVPKLDVERVQYLYNLYEQALNILESLGALLVIKRPELLLTYHYYEVYITNFPSDDPDDSIRSMVTCKNKFIQLSKQFWFDVLLQTYKVLVLNRLIFSNKKTYKAPKQSSVHDKYTSCIKAISRNKHLFSGTELLLMNWLEFHYNEVRCRLWSQELEHRKIRYYGEGMEDGFVYAAVTIAYCPYLTEHFEDMFLKPDRIEELMHNNIKLIQSWHILNFSMKLVAKDVAQPNSFRTLYLMVYLYQMLPNLYPSETITFRTDLSQHAQREFLLRNVNHFSVAYKAILYGGDANCFETNREFYVIPGKGSCVVVIDYWAKFIKEARSTLILSGECKGYHHAKSMAITLIGIPNVHQVTQAFTSDGVLYRLVERQLNIKSPYLNAAEYRIQFTSVVSLDIDQINALPYREDFPKQGFVRVLPFSNSIKTDDNGEGILDYYILCLRPIPMSTWIYFRNTEVGDFAIKLTTSCKPSFPQEVLKVYVPKENNSKGNLRTVTMYVPCQNKFIWRAIAEMYSTVTGKDIEFWKKYSCTEIGIHILQKMVLFSVPPYNYQLHEVTKFKAKVTQNCEVEFPRLITVDNHHLANTIAVPVKILSGPKLPEPLDLCLVSLDNDKQLIRRATTCEDRKACLEVHGVRITPPFIHFKHAFEGRMYRQNLTIRNVGKSKVLVKIARPTSLAFSIKEVKGYSLSPGLCLVKEVSYVYMHTNVPYCVLPIFVDDERIDYEVFAEESAPEISVDPQSLDFGLVDTYSASTLRIITIRNDGSQPARFFVDTISTLGHKYMADPNKGFIQPKSCVNVHVKIASTFPSQISDNMWLNCDRPYAIPIKAEFISPCFEPIHELTAKSFTVVKFPPTYIGVASSKTVYVRNYSANAAMFCLKGEVDTQITNLKECRESEEDYNYFEVYPKDGVWESKEVKAFHFLFNPVKPASDKQLKHFYFSIYHICRIDCRYLHRSMYEGKLFAKGQEFHIARSAQSVKGIREAVKLARASVLLGSIASSIPVEAKSKHEPHSMKLYVHAVAEEPSVTVLPDEIRILNMLEGQRGTRVLRFRNNSRKLPIVISYCKAAYVDLDPPTFNIEANKSIEVSVSITPRKTGRYTTTLQFDLKFYDESQIKKELKIIGNVKVLLDVDMKCAKNVQLPKIGPSKRLHCAKEVRKLSRVKTAERSMVPVRNVTSKQIKCDLAFPKDSPWSCSKTAAISEKLLQYTQRIGLDCELTIFGEKMKINSDSYYNNHVNKTTKQLQLVTQSEKALDDYDLTNPMKLLCENFHLPSTFKKRAVEHPYSEFIPLSPAELNNIVIDPLAVYTERIAVQSEYNFKLTIKNSNTLPIRIFLRPEKPNIMFPEGNRQIILPTSAVSLPISYISATSGYYTASFEVIVNECSVFVVNIMADVSPIYLKLNTDAIQFTDQNSRFIEISNPLNAETYFRWSLDCRNFSINPIEGIIRGQTKLACEVTYASTEEGPELIDADLLAFEVITQQLRLSVNGTRTKLKIIPDELVFEDIPLNIPISKKVLLRNDTECARAFTLVDFEFLRYADVYPANGIIYGNSCVLIKVTLKVKTCIRFSVKLKFEVKGVGVIELPIRGNVIYPDIVVDPQLLKFPKIPAGTVETLRFRVENRSRALATIKFDLALYDDCKISETKCDWEMDFVDELMLNGHSSKYLYIHFAPNAITTDEFDLPIIVNDIIKPSSKEGQKCGISYAPHESIPNCKEIMTRTFFAVPRVRIYATAHKLKCSRRKVYLTYKLPPLPCKNEYNLRISNPQKTEDTFCIRTDDLAHPLYLTHASGRAITFYEKSIVCTLDSREEVVINLTFKPDTAGTFAMTLPVYLKSDMTTHPHNTLYVEGVFKLPEMIISNPGIYQKPGPLLVSNTVVVRLYLKDHLENCKLWVSQDVRGWNAELLEEKIEDFNTRSVLLNVTFTTDQVGVFEANHYVNCTCGVTGTVTMVRCRENCFLTNYAQVETFIHDNQYNLHLRKMESECSRRISLASVLENERPLKEVYEMDTFFAEYPFFPEHDTELKEFLEPVVEMVEYWAYTQGFFENSFYSIPRGFAAVMFDCPVVIPPFIQLLLNITQNELEEYFDLRYPGEDDIEKVKYVYELYSKALDFLQSIGALLVYTHPEILLCYPLYKIFLNKFDHSDQDEFHVTITNKEDFYRLSKQYWLDVLLQTYKVLVLKRLFFMRSGIYKAPRESSAYQRYATSIKKIVMNKHLLSNAELLLLNWFEFHYNDVRKKCWSRNSYLKEREITFFGENMADGFVYAAVMISYCPYLSAHFEDMCQEPLLPEEILHNNIRVIQSWRILGFSLKVTAGDIAEPNSLKTLMIMTYLYQMLPDMYPLETLSFSAGLSQHSQETLVLRNVNAFPIAYKAVLYGADSERFEVKEFHVISPRSDYKVVVDYWAKFVKKTYCTLILSGECAGYRHATSSVINLIGNPDVTYTTAEMEVENESYRMTLRTLKVKSPYVGAVVYKTQFAIKLPTAIDEVNALPYDLPPNTSSRFMPVGNWVSFDSDGEGSMDVHITCLTTLQRSIWIFFRNDEVGDFAIKVITSCKVVVVRELLEVPIPKPEAIEPPAKGTFRNVNLQIPARYKEIWAALGKAFTEVCSDEKGFWKTYVHTTVGIHILQKILLHHTLPFEYNFCESVRYKTKVTTHCGVKLPTYVDIESECSLRLVEVPIQIPCTLDMSNTIDFELVSLDGSRHRHYTIVFAQESD